MLTIHSIALLIHVVISAMIIGLVLFQRGAGADAGAAFGSGASGTVFGAKGSANFLSRSTAVLAALFFASSLFLAFIGAERPVVESLMSQPESTGVEITSSQPFDEEIAESFETLPDMPGLETSGDDFLQPESGSQPQPVSGGRMKFPPID